MSFQSKQTLHELYLNCHDELENLLFSRLPCRETASDISQEAFVRLCRVDDLGSIDNLKAYLFRTALNLLFDHYRSQSVRKAATAEWLDDTVFQPEDHRCAETVASAEQQLDRLIEVLSVLSPLCQRIFYLNRFKGLKHREIAETLNISVRTVEENIKRAVIHCSKMLNHD